MIESVKTILYPVKDLEKSKKLFTALLEAKPEVDSPAYVGFKVDNQDIGLVPNGFEIGMSGPLPYLHVSNIKAKFEELESQGFSILHQIRDVGNGRLVGSVKDTDGNEIGLLQDSK